MIRDGVTVVAVTVIDHLHHLGDVPHVWGVGVVVVADCQMEADAQSPEAGQQPTHQKQEGNQSLRALHEPIVPEGSAPVKEAARVWAP